MNCLTGTGTRRSVLRKLLPVVLAIMLVFGLCGRAFAADSAVGTDMRLTAVEGTVTLKNINGKALSVREGMKLYSGYTLSTSTKSYAYVTLDSQKVIKLDANSKVEIRAKSSKLEIMLLSGKLFFNVKSPLSSSESMNIRTSTMVTGIRGTSGYVSVLSAASSSVAITDGKVEVYGVDTSSGSQLTAVHAGQTASVLVRENGADTTVSLSSLTAESIPGFVAVELQKDNELQQRVQEATGLPVEEIIASAGERLEEDEQNVQAAMDEAGELTDRVTQAPIFHQPETDINPGYYPDVPYWPEYSEPDTSEPSSEPDNSSDTSSDTDNSDTSGDTTSPENPDTSYTVTGNITIAELTAFLNQYDTVIVSTGASVTVSNVADTIPAGKEVILNGSMNIENNGKLTNNGTLTVSSGGQISIAENSIDTDDGGSIVNQTNNLLINIGSLVVASSGSVINNSYAPYTVDGTCGLNNYGSVRIEEGGSFANNGNFCNYTGGTVEKLGTWSGSAVTNMNGSTSGISDVLPENP